MAEAEARPQKAHVSSALEQTPGPIQPAPEPPPQPEAAPLGDEAPHPPAQRLIVGVQVEREQFRGERLHTPRDRERHAGDNGREGRGHPEGHHEDHGVAEEVLFVY